MSKSPVATILKYCFVGFRLIVTSALLISSADWTITSLLIDPVKSIYGPSVVLTPAFPLTPTVVAPIVTPPENET
jgi:hypothetical protein